MQTEETIARECQRSGEYVDLTVRIVSAFVANNLVPVAGLPDLMASVHGALVGLTQPQAAAEPEVAKPSPAEIRKSITPDALISFIDGRSYKTLRRHLTKHGLTPDAYRARYGLPIDYPSTAPAYSAQRSALAKTLGLGRSGATANTLAA